VGEYLGRHWNLDAEVQSARMLGKGRWIADVSLFDLPACQELGIERNPSTLEFLDSIPDLVEEKAEA